MDTKKRILTPPSLQVKKPVVRSHTDQASVTPATISTKPLQQVDAPKPNVAMRQEPLNLGVEMKPEPVASPKPTTIEKPNQLSGVEQKKRNVEAFREFYSKEKGEKVLTPEEEEKARKRARSKALINAIGDGISAMANLYYTTKGAPDAYTPSGSLSRAGRARYDRMMADRDRRRRELNMEADKMYNLYKEEERAKEALAYRRAQDKKAEMRYQEEQDYRRKKDKEDREARTEAARVEGERWQKMFDLKVKQYEETKRKNNMDNALSIATAQEKNTIPVFLSDTEEVRIPTHIWNNKDRIAAVYEALPDNLKEQAIKRYATVKETKYDSEKKDDVIIYEPMTWQQMQQAVGAFIADPEAVKAQNLARRMAGQDVPKGLGWGATKHTTDDEQTDW